jgi:tRNA A58 N-methylase Trm61
MNEDREALDKVIRTIREAIAAIGETEIYVDVAKVQMRYYNALRAAGFSDQEAFELLKISLQKFGQS